MSGRGSGGRAPRTSSVSRDGKNGSRKPYDRRSASTKYRNDNRNGSNRDRQSLPDFDTDGTEYIKIASESNTKKVAGKIAHEVREGNKAPTILAIGAASLNASVKAIAVARRYISDDRLDLTCQPAFREGMSETCLALYLHKRHGNTYDTVVDDAEELNVKGTTAVPGLAGAISGRVREGKQIYLIAQGQDAVTCAIASICKSRTYLEEDGLDVHCAPKFVHIERGGSQMTAMRFDIISENAA